ncbi:hypothetical protein ILYODFUR_001154 [Ilyodon furcidens]|uniref:Uncharacterized protein n=1 Tax=Ilyodon furcidens TaxID=33524 RepID=A0ABV0UCD5_9TELE
MPLFHELYFRMTSHRFYCTWWQYWEKLKKNLRATTKILKITMARVGQPKAMAVIQNHGRHLWLWMGGSEAPPPAVNGNTTGFLLNRVRYSGVEPCSAGIVNRKEV